MRCLNIDWLEVYCLEDYIGYPHDADYFRREGFQVEQREYGTRLYSQMFTVYDADGQPFCEIRRDPCANHIEGSTSFIEHNAAHVRLVNRSCYYEDAAFRLASFLEAHGYAYRSLYRVDLALDFVRFDSHDPVDRFIDRYLRGVYTKINQSNLRAYGEDRWDNRSWHSLSWGSKVSPVVTRLYCKSKELKEVHDKPYIRQAWHAAGLIHDFRTMAVLTPDGKTVYPDVWRLEFQINSQVRNWLRCEDCTRDKTRYVSIRNDLSVYATKQSQLDVFASLCYHYFHFKLYKSGVRKDRCPDKVLWNFKEAEAFYHVDKAVSATPSSKPLESLRIKLGQFKLSCTRPELIRACDTLLEAITQRQIVDAAVRPFDKHETALLRELFGYRANCKPNESVDQSRRFITDLFSLLEDTY